MLRALRPGEGPPEPAYRVPWTIDRATDAHPVVTNDGPHTLDFVRVFVHRPGSMPDTELWGMMPPGAAAELCLCDVDLDAAVITVAWFRPTDSGEYIWRFVV